MAMVDVVVVTWNDKANAEAAVDSVLALPEYLADPHFARVTVSDNGSEDGTVDFLRRRYGERVDVLENGANLGFGTACNRAIAATRAPFILLLNPDARLQHGALAQLIAFMEQRPRCALAGPKIRDAAGEVSESCGEFDTWVGAFLRSSAWGEFGPLRRFANGARLRAWKYDNARKVDILIGAVLLVRRSAFLEVGGFDERFFLYHEEVDLAKRIADAGYEAWFVLNAEAVHLERGSSRGRFDVEPLKRRSRRLYWLKHHGRLWYGTLCAALVGRYALYPAAGAAVFALLRAARR